MGRQMESYHNFLHACKMPTAVYEEGGDEVSLEVAIVGVKVTALKVAPDVEDEKWNPRENLCAQAIELLKGANIWGLRGNRLRMHLKDLGIDIEFDGPADVLVVLLKEGQFTEAKAETQLLDEKLGQFVQDDLVKMVAQLGHGVSYQLQDAPDDLAQLSCGFILRLLASLDGSGGVRDESPALGLIRLIEAVLFFYIPFREWGDKLIGVFCRVIRHLLEKKVAPFMARTRLECVEFFFNLRAHNVLPKLQDLKGNKLEESQERLLDFVDILPEERRTKMNQAFAKDICTAAKESFDGTCRLFGSLVNGFATAEADIDVGIHMDGAHWDRYLWKGHWEHWRQRAAVTRRVVRGEGVSGVRSANEPVKELRDLMSASHLSIVLALRDLAEKMEEKEYMVVPVESARIPILRCTKGDIHVDISLSHEVVFYNSRLLKCYSLLATEVVSLSLLVKRWAKIRDVNDALQGTLSSYSFILLVIGFLQYLKLLPNLQDPKLIEGLEVDEENTIEDEGVIDLRFFDFEKEGLSAEEARAKFALEPMPPMYTLLVEFFRYFAYRFNFYSQGISIKHHLGILPKPDLFGLELEDDQNIWRYRKRLWLSILDPFEPTRVLGCSARGQERLSLELRRAYDLLCAGEVERLFVAYDHRCRNERHFTYSLGKLMRLDHEYRSRKWLAPLAPLDIGKRYQGTDQKEVTEDSILEAMGQHTSMEVSAVERTLGKSLRGKQFTTLKLKDVNGVQIIERGRAPTSATSFYACDAKGEGRRFGQHDRDYDRNAHEAVGFRPEERVQNWRPLNGRRSDREAPVDRRRADAPDADYDRSRIPTHITYDTRPHGDGRYRKAWHGEAPRANWQGTREGPVTARSSSHLSSSSPVSHNTPTANSRDIPAYGVSIPNVQHPLARAPYPDKNLLAYRAPVLSPKMGREHIRSPALTEGERAEQRLRQAAKKGKNKAPKEPATSVAQYNESTMTSVVASPRVSRGQGPDPNVRPPTRVSPESDAQPSRGAKKKDERPPNSDGRANRSAQPTEPRNGQDARMRAARTAQNEQYLRTAEARSTHRGNRGGKKQNEGEQHGRNMQRSAKTEENSNRVTGYTEDRGSREDTPIASPHGPLPSSLFQ